MFVNSIMIPKHNSYFISSETTVGDTLRELERLDVDGLPVVKDKKYIGAISRVRIYKAFFEQEELSREEFSKNVLIENLVTRQDVYIREDEIFENTLMLVQNFPAVAVVDEKLNYLGVVTRHDILEELKSAFGMKREGVRLAFTTVDSEGRLAKLAELTRQYHENIISVATFDETDKLARRIVMKVEKNQYTKQFIKKIEEAGFRILDISGME